MRTELITEKYSLYKEVVEAQMTLLCNFVHSLAFYRTIRQDYDRIEDNKKFWTHFMNSCYLRAITDWCIVFGANNNEAHWKKTAKNKNEEFKSEIRPMIYSAAEISQNKWKEYHKEVVDFRNRYAAHRNIDYKDNVPLLRCVTHNVISCKFPGIVSMSQETSRNYRSVLEATL